MMMAVASAAGAGSVLADSLTYGNNSENILNGGVIATDGSKTYFANTQKGNALYAGTEKSVKKLSSDAAENINVVGKYIYYTTAKSTGSAIVRMSKSGGSRKVLSTSSSVIEEMYVDSEGTVYYLTGGKVFEKAAKDDKAQLVAQGGITHFIPTVHGVITAKGSRGNYTIFADGVKIKGGVDSFYTIDNYLLFTIGSHDYQVKIRDMFDHFQASDIEKYNLGNDVDALQAFADALADDDCEECRKNAAHALTHVAGADEEVDAVRDLPGVVSSLGSSSVGQQNMVKRATQQSKVRWTPQQNIVGWGGGYIFAAGTTYEGLPYGQPVTAAYVPWDASLEEFVAAVNDTGSKMYTSRSTYNRTAPYYSCDCSSFVSWSWDLPSRQYTRSIVGYCEAVASQSIYSAQIGDAFNLAGSHVVMVSDVGYRGDQIVYIDIMEQTPPSTKYTRWGEGGTKTLEELATKYFGRGYTLYRSKTRDNVTYTPSPVVSLPGDGTTAAPSVPTPGGDFVEDDNQAASFESADVVIAEGASLELKCSTTQRLSLKGMAASAATWSSSNADVARVTSKHGVVKAVSAGSAEITARVGLKSAKILVYVAPAKTVITSVSAGKNGTMTLTWGKVAGAEGYEILRKSATEDWKSIGTTRAHSFMDKGLALNTTYTYAVRGYILAEGKTLYADYDANGVSGRTVLEAPALKTVTSVGTGSQKITWSKVEGAEGYRVYGKKAGTRDWKTRFALGDTTKTDFTVSGLTCGDTYVYTVRAFFKNGATAVLGNFSAAGISGKVLPATPVMRAAYAYSDHIEVSWKTVKGAAGYNVYRRTKNGAYTLIGSASTNKYMDKDVKVGEKYTYAVAAKSANGIVGSYKKAGISCNMVPGTPLFRSVNSDRAGRATVTWKKVTGADGYKIYLRSGSGNYWLAGTVGKNRTNFSKSNLKSGTVVTFMIKAYWNTGKGEVRGAFPAQGATVTVK